MVVCILVCSLDFERSLNLEFSIIRNLLLILAWDLDLDLEFVLDFDCDFDCDFEDILFAVLVDYIIGNN